MLIVNLCKFIEPRKEDKNKYTLKHFINLMKYPPNRKMLKNACASKVITFYHIRTGEFEKEDFSEQYTERFNKINFEQDLEEINIIHSKICDYRNKRLCHNDKTYCDYNEMPNIDELHSDIDKLEEMMKKYYEVFGISVNFNKQKNSYNNFQLLLP